MDRAAKLKKSKVWKGKLISDKKYLLKLKQVERGRALGKTRDRKESEVTPENIEGRRIIDMEVLKKFSKCMICQESISMANCGPEKRYGLASVFPIRCEKCLFVNQVPTDRMHTNPGTNRLAFDINSKAALGTLDAGLGYTQLKKVLATLDVPAMSSETYKKHEREVGHAVEAVAANSCYETAKLERDLTIADAQNMSKLLPEEAAENFILPDREDCSAAPNEVEDSEKVRIFASGDMGYSGRGTGFSFNSLNGYTALQGFKSKKILSYYTTNRACSCGSNHTIDCRKNFYGSAKAMEAHATAKLASENEIFKDLNLELGVFIGDNDASSIKAVQNAVNHPVYKFSDRNHTAKGVSNLLWKIAGDKSKDPKHELTASAIKSIVKSFTYAIAQNIGDTKSLKAVISNIPYHFFNFHENCGHWCGFQKDPENYSHKSIPGGLENGILFDNMLEAFDKLAENAQQFSSGATTQGNESLNAMMARKASIAICFSKTASADFRFACTVSQKNEGTSYLEQTISTLGMECGKTLKKCIAQDAIAKEKRTIERNTPAYKLKRRRRSEEQSQLRYRRQNVEPDTYQSHMGLLPEARASTDIPEQFREFTHDYDDFSKLKSIPVFFDLETSGFSKTADVLQIAMKHKDSIFNEYIQPCGLIPPAATEVHGLSGQGGRLYRHGVAIACSPRNKVLANLLQYLTNCVGDSAKKCVLIAHNCSFDSPRLLRIIDAAGMRDSFGDVIFGFSDTLALFRNKFPERKDKGSLTLTTLAVDTLSIDVMNAHDAVVDICLLEKLALHHLSWQDFHNFSKTFESDKNFSTLDELSEILAKGSRQKLADAGVSMDLLSNILIVKGKEKVIEVLQQCKNGKPTILKSKKKIECIIDYLCAKYNTKE